MAVLFIPAKYYRSGRTRPIRLIVIHCTVGPEMGTSAEAVARYFSTIDRKASAHRTADSNSIVMSVSDFNTAYAAAGANADGLHIELCGMPQQSATEWLDAFGQSMLPLAAGQVAEWADLYDIPLRWLTVDQVRDGKTKGLCTHHDVSQAFPDVSTGHWDPGPNFPRDTFLRMAAGVPDSPPPIEEEAMIPTGPCIRLDARGREWTFIVGADGYLWRQINANGTWVQITGGMFKSSPSVERLSNGGWLVAGTGLDDAVWSVVVTESTRKGTFVRRGGLVETDPERPDK